MRRSALIVAVPEAEPLVSSWRERYDRAAETSIPAHVTLLFPFVPAEEVDDALVAELRELFAAQSAFRFSLPRVERFVDHAWLAPEPPEPFIRLTELLVASYPNYPPYEGIHDSIVPHLAVVGGDRALQDEAEAALTPALPIDAEAHEVLLLEELLTGRWLARERFPLGS